MRKLQVVLAAAMMVATSTAAVAQDAPPQQQGRPGGGNQMATLMKDITLSADQQAKVDSLGKKLQADMQALRADSTTDRETRMAKSRELRTKQYEAIKAILTDDQKKVFDKNLADLQARMQQGGGRPPQR